MTKSKPVAPKPVKPLIAWCLLNSDGNIRPVWISDDEALVARWAKSFGRKMIRVEIRPAPKRKGAKP